MENKAKKTVGVSKKDFLQFFNLPASDFPEEGQTVILHGHTGWWANFGKALTGKPQQLALISRLNNQVVIGAFDCPPTFYLYEQEDAKGIALRFSYDAKSERLTDMHPLEDEVKLNAMGLNRDYYDVGDISKKNRLWSPDTMLQLLRHTINAFRQGQRFSLSKIANRLEKQNELTKSLFSFEETIAAKSSVTIRRASAVPALPAASGYNPQQVKQLMQNLKADIETIPALKDKYGDLLTAFENAGDPEEDNELKALTAPKTQAAKEDLPRSWDNLSPRADK